MKFAVSVALMILLLGMPLSCVLANCQVPAPCCPHTSTSFRCPYDALDSAKIAGIAAVANVPMAVATRTAPPDPRIDIGTSPTPTQDRTDLYILNRILRI
jgi:hypothetical protein